MLLSTASPLWSKWGKYRDSKLLFASSCVQNYRYLMQLVCQNCTTRLSRSSRAWVTSDYVTSVPCRISRLPTALSRCWDNGSIRMDHDPGLDVPGTLEINARVMIPIVLFHRQRKRGNGSFLVHLSVIRIDWVCHLQNTCFTERYNGGDLFTVH